MQSFKKISYWIYSNFRDVISRIHTISAPVQKAAYSDGSDRNTYEPSGWSALRRASRWVPFSSDDVFVDFGCGKGRIVYLAAKYPIKKVIGVENNGSLTDIARENIERNYNHLRCKTIDLITADVLDFKIPDDMTIAYFYNPFINRSFMKVIDNIHRSMQQTSRPVWMIYLNPIMNYALKNHTWLRLIAEYRDMYIYRAEL
jgi:SAM-dependent methyltransferase